MDCHEEIIGKLHQHKKSKLPRKLIINKKYITLKALRQPRQKFDQKFNILFFLQQPLPTLSKIVL